MRNPKEKNRYIGIIFRDRIHKTIKNIGVGLNFFWGFVMADFGMKIETLSLFIWIFYRKIGSIVTEVSK